MNRLILILCTATFLSLSCAQNKNLDPNVDVIATDCAPLPNGHAKIIKHGWDVPIISLAMNNQNFIKEVEDSPYDGIVLSAGQISNDVFSGTNVSQNEIDAAFSAMNGNDFSRELENFVKMNVFKNVGTAPYEGVHFYNLIINVKRFARAAKNAGFTGITFDNESYDGNNNWVWSENDSESICPGKTREECATIVRNAGFDVGNAILQEWNTVKFMPFFGIWLRNEASWNVIQANSPHNKWYSENKLEAEFLVGIFRAIVDRKKTDPTCTAEYMNGGEIYSLETREQFANVAHHIKTELPFQAPQFLDYLRQPYADQVKISFGIYDFRNRMFGVPPYSAEKFVEIVRNAAQEADYIWLYPELYDFWTHDGNNWPTNKAPQKWIDELKCGLK